MTIILELLLVSSYSVDTDQIAELHFGFTNIYFYIQHMIYPGWLDLNKARAIYLWTGFREYPYSKVFQIRL